MYGTFFLGLFSSFADSRGASCQLLAKEWTLSTGKLPPGGLPKNVLIPWTLSNNMPSRSCALINLHGND